GRKLERADRRADHRAPGRAARRAGCGGVSSGEASAGQTVDTARRALTARFKSADIESAELDSRLLVGATLNVDLTGLITAANRRLTPDESDRLEAFAA